MARVRGALRMLQIAEAAYTFPEFLKGNLAGRDPWFADDYLLAGARAVCWVRSAAGFLEQLAAGASPGDRALAEYHTYAGVSAARTALDALANWLRVVLLIPDAEFVPSQRDFAVSKFRRRLKKEEPHLGATLGSLFILTKEIDPLRQAAQHREGIPISFAVLKEAPSQGARWRLKGRSFERGRVSKTYRELELVALLSGWADQIDTQLQQLLRALPGE